MGRLAVASPDLSSFFRSCGFLFFDNSFTTSARAIAQVARGRDRSTGTLIIADERGESCPHPLPLSLRP